MRSNFFRLGHLVIKIYTETEVDETCNITKGCKLSFSRYFTNKLFIYSQTWTLYIRGGWLLSIYNLIFKFEERGPAQTNTNLFLFLITLTNDECKRSLYFRVYRYSLLIFLFAALFVRCHLKKINKMEKKLSRERSLWNSIFLLHRFIHFISNPFFSLTW